MQAQQRFEELFRKHSAQELRKHVTVGESCPVCDHIVERLPKRLPEARLDQARSEAEHRHEIWQKVLDALASDS
jgi:hypothetical protein